MKNKLIRKGIKLFTNFVLFLFIVANSSLAQNIIEISGPCVSGTVILSEDVAYNGKQAHSGTGTIWSTDNTQFAAWWDSSENLWFLALDGQPFWYNSDNTEKPNSTLLSGNWTQIDDSYGTCDIVIGGTATNMPDPTAIATTESLDCKIYSRFNVIYVKMTSAENSIISVFDLNGKKIKEISSRESYVEIQPLSKGIYIVRVDSDRITTIQKVFIK